MRIIAKAYGDRPLDRVAVGWDAKVVYVAAKSVADAMQEGEVGGVGFPRNCIFEFDSSLYDSLRRAWEKGDAQGLADLWRQATPFQRDAKIAA